MKDFELQEQVSEVITDPKDFLGISSSLAVLTKDVADTLERQFPGWMWAVCPFEFGGIIKIFSLQISGEFGFTIKTDDIQNDPRRRLAVEAGGEILERYGLPRGPYRRELLMNKPRDIRGDLIPDITDKDQRTQKRERDRTLDKALSEGKAKMVAVDRTDEQGNTFREIHMKIGGDDDVHGE